MNEIILIIFVRVYHTKNKLRLSIQVFQVKISLNLLLKKHQSVFFFLALQLASTSPLLPINSTQQSIEESAILRTLRMNALQVCSF